MQAGPVASVPPSFVARLSGFVLKSGNNQMYQRQNGPGKAYVGIFLFDRTTTIEIADSESLD